MLLLLLLLLLVAFLEPVLIALFWTGDAKAATAAACRQRSAVPHTGINRTNCE
jgi:flagellar basal body-associated protein FliL